ncbi:response regulator transcription factor [Azospirillum halopraeferens]|uniref:response regulator transcription factor n=1 Tax=Azospirillum halopraeferens TaxID=34010 RepID=UPI000491480D|nr:response regulator [Azospirillum halopraeferens]
MSDDSLIAVVDDDESAREAVAGLVRSLGFLAAEFGSAADFLASDQRSRTACLIADVRMPGVTGPELYSHLMASGTPIPTVLITAYAREAARDRALKSGIRCYLAKPLDPDELLACIRSAIGDGKGRIE